MTGRLSFGKMSIGIRDNAKIEQSPIARRATTTLIGCRKAVRISHILLASCRSHRREKWFEIALGQSLPKNGAPNPQTCEVIIDFCLQQKPLCFSNLDDRRQRI